MDEETLNNLKKQMGLKIKRLRTEKNWSRKYIANKLAMSVPGYGSIERGETDVCVTWLAQLAEIFEITLSNLLGMTEKTVTQTTSTCFGINPILNNLDDLNLKQELEKYQQIQQAQQKEIENLQRQITQLEESFKLLKDERLSRS